jgi:hypothetical protein
VTLSETGGAQKVVYCLAAGLDREKFEGTSWPMTVRGDAKSGNLLREQVSYDMMMGMM